MSLKHYGECCAKHFDAYQHLVIDFPYFTVKLCFKSVDIL